MRTDPSLFMVVSFMTSTIVRTDSLKGCGLWSASVASMMSRSMSLTSGRFAEGMER